MAGPRTSRVAVAGVGYRVVNAFPAAPDLGHSVLHTGAGTTFVWDGSRWRGTEGITYVYPVGADIAARRAVVIVAGKAELCDIATHDRADGVVVAVVDGGTLAVVRSAGAVEGFAGDGGLALGEAFVGAVPGRVVTAPPEGDRLRLGWAQTADRLMVDLGEPTVGG